MAVFMDSTGCSIGLDASGWLYKQMFVQVSHR